mgnify:CR=1 FL=1
MKLTNYAEKMAREYAINMNFLVVISTFEMETKSNKMVFCNELE